MITPNGLVVYVAPLVLGTRATPGFVFSGPDSIGDATRFELVGAHVLGPDVRLDYEPLTVEVG